MNLSELINKKQEEFNQKNYIQFEQQDLEQLDAKSALKVIDHFHGHTLMKLPQTEIDFFEWLKINDNAVWNDLWQDEEDLYMVSIDLLRHFLKGKSGFPICDLEIPNYYFTVKHIKPKGLEQMETILSKTESGKKLDIDELLLFELHLAPTDIWHFSYRYDLPVIEVKELVSEMDYKGWIVHLPKSEDLLRYIDF